MIRTALILFPLLLSAAHLRAELTPAENVIAAAQRALEADPDNALRHNDLALGYARRARETADMDDYEKAHQELDRSLDIEPDNYGARRLRVWTLLGQHRFAEALDQAKALNEIYPDDVLIYGFLADAQIELGRYEEATDLVQWMLDLRPGNVPGLTRAAYVRELHGWYEGAIDFMQKAYDRTRYNEREDRAWIQTQLAHLEQLRGDREAADKHASLALSLFPDYHYALAELGRIRLAQNRVEEAAEAFRQRYEAAPHPENLFELGRALEKVGRHGEAKQAYAEFERSGRAEMHSWDNCNRDLIDYYADIADKPQEALKIAEAEMERRQDLFTRAAYAWALYKVGRTAEAHKEMERALSTGYKEDKLLQRAQEIAKANELQARR